MLIAINRSHKNKHPDNMTAEQTKAWFRKYNRNFCNENLPTDMLITEITSGWGIAACHNGYRHSRNFLCAQHVGIDIDGGATMEEVANDEFVAAFASFIYTTPSHTEDDPHLRVIFELDRPIRDALRYTDLVQAIMWRLNIPLDRVCKDPSRLFFGNENAQVVVIGHVLSLETAAPTVEEWREYKRQELEKKRLSYTGKIDTNVSAARSDGLLRTLCDHIRRCPDGEKYVTLRDISRTVGGYVATGVIDYTHGYNTLWDAISSRRTVKDWTLAQKTIIEWMEKGMNDPLYLTDRDRSTDPWKGVSPPLSPAQKQQVNETLYRINGQSFLDGFHAGVNAVTRKAWGLPDAILEQYSLGYREKQINQETGEILDKALVVPFISPDGDVLNVEYRLEDGVYEYETSIPALFYADYTSKERPTIITTDSKKCLDVYLNWGATDCAGGGYYQYAALPHLPVDQQAMNGMVEPIIITGPGDRLDDKTIATLRSIGATSATLPLPVAEMVRMGVNEKMFAQYLMQRRAL